MLIYISAVFGQRTTETWGQNNVVNKISDDELLYRFHFVSLLCQKKKKKSHAMCMICTVQFPCDKILLYFTVTTIRWLDQSAIYLFSFQLCIMSSPPISRKLVWWAHNHLLHLYFVWNIFLFKPIDQFCFFFPGAVLLFLPRCIQTASFRPLSSQPA